jgi:hypothetical protein
MEADRNNYKLKLEEHLEEFQRINQSYDFLMKRNSEMEKNIVNMKREKDTTIEMESINHSNLIKSLKAELDEIVSLIE